MPCIFSPITPDFTDKIKSSKYERGDFSVISFSVKSIIESNSGLSIDVAV